MQINADFSQRVVIHSTDLDWVDSPISGVSRRMLDRIGGEVARATTIVRYAPDSRFSPHVHTGGEEFIVLEGVFQDEHGDFPAGSYIRNPPQSSHTPGSEQGCVIFVKLWQFDLEDRFQLRVDMGEVAPVSRRANGSDSKVAVTQLFQDARETVRMERWQSSAVRFIDAPFGAEVLVLEGGFEESGDRLKQHSWLRVPVGGSICATAGESGARVWIKTGQLRHVEPPALPSRLREKE